MTVKDLSAFDSQLSKGQKADTLVTLAGRVQAKRESSAKLVFYDIIQNGEPIQVVVSRGRFEGSFDEFAAANQEVCRGDIVSFTGVPGKTNHGQLSVFVTKDMRVLSPCLHDIPKHELKDPEKRFRERHLDMLVNPHVTDIMRTRTKIIRFIRRFLDDRDFLEVETPVLSGKAGGANAKPFETHAHALDMDMQLRIAPELYLKQLVVGGIDRVYEIGKQFRNEGIDADHNPEFTTCEFYQAYGNLESLIQDTETMLSEMVESITGTRILESHKGEAITFDRPFKRINVLDRLETQLGIPIAELDGKLGVDTLLQACRELSIPVSRPFTTARILDKLISHLIEPECTQPTFLYNHPIALSPLAKGGVDEKGRRIAARFELFVRGKEIVNAYEELNDPVEQRLRFQQQANDRVDGDDEAPVPDLAFCQALEYGLPPTAGWGMGVDRVVQILTGATHIREVLAFPVMRPLQSTTPKTSISVASF
ncbi:protein KARS-1, isoform c [Phycomyces blakesleeanus]|uniref:Lysine--tRNA ligase n=2 Tax=Phycomyces blakesleeanus TaxID=4837 RepID=A0A162UQ09_PHYB8|nr:hypothetical protein PHYBLDRAFT_154757 [Phycomyces blakesleeanus NRRL 1555(-)]OAD76963.1 hypothetical protein PHYBLDRAFT_154757 [Phycomyces blakesleeanus NRRL 1555(-)]|eukprot:XP_018295003.1 hypothetical protein PHYBLDRAFT_154757 [Phycomyces blakesleeanus NRRL 1555(-)]